MVNVKSRNSFPVLSKVPGRRKGKTAMLLQSTG
jgi:hypothetical protein